MIDGFSRNGALFDTSGVSPDGWCQRRVRFKAGVSAPLTLCELEIWLKREPTRQRSRFRARFGDDAFEFELAHDASTRVQIACPAFPGDVIEATIECDNEVSDKGEDQRSLSFQLNSVRFW